MKVIKRNGDLVEFDLQKIENAVTAAFADFEEDFTDSATLEEIKEHILETDSEAIGVEIIQDIVENILLDNGYIDEARHYIRYRYDHELARTAKSLREQIEKDEAFEKALEEKLMAANVQNQNANVDEHSFGGRIGETASMVMKKFALEHCMSEKSRFNHENNYVYIHDLDQYVVGSHNCLSIPFDDLLANGFNTRQTDVRPANSISTAMQLVAVIFQLQSLQQFGRRSAC